MDSKFLMINGLPTSIFWLWCEPVLGARNPAEAFESWRGACPGWVGSGCNDMYAAATKFQPAEGGSMACRYFNWNRRNIPVQHLKAHSVLFCRPERLTKAGGSTISGPGIRYRPCSSRHGALQL